MTKLEGIVQRVKFQSGSFHIFEVTFEDEVNGKCNGVACGHLFGVRRLTRGAALRVMGTWGEHPKHGRQFRVQTWEPWCGDSEGFRVFFTYCIRGSDVSSVDAICSQYGGAVLEALGDPAKVMREVAANRVDLQSTVLGWEQALATCGLSQFLDGLSPDDIEIALQKFGPEAASLLKADPYRLLEVPGFSFRKADDFATSLGLPLSSPERVRGAVLWLLDYAGRYGHLFLPPLAIPGLASAIPSDTPVEGDYALALETLAAQGAVRVEGTSRAYLPAPFEYERRSAECLAALLSPATLNIDPQAFLEDFQRSANLELSEAQKDVVRALSTSRVLVITGLPGTGKSTSVLALVRLFEKARISFSLMAPTGIAAKRLSHITGHPAATIHRALGYDGTEWVHGLGNKFVIDAVIVDEVSMVDQELLYRLLVALRPDTILVLVGDAAQLPSVGAGNVLKELTGCDPLPRVNLTQIFRQSAEGGIVSNSHRINRGEFPELGDPKGTSEFKFIPLLDGQQVQDCVVRMAAKLKARDANFQVLTAKYKGVVGVDALNDALREVLNPPGAPEWRGEAQHFRVGDRVMVVKNDYKKNVYNGDVGKLLHVLPDRLVVRIYGVEDDCQVDFTEVEAEETLRLAYAVTVHRSQGNEFDTIILPVVQEQGRMLQRNLLYTAVTRAKRQVWLLGQRAAIQRAIDNNKVIHRNTVLSRAITGVLQRSQSKGETSGTSEDHENL